MAFTFTNAQIDEIRLLMERIGVEGNYASAYRRVAEILSTPLANGATPTDDPSIKQVYRWFQGAEQANAGEGIFSTFIREYMQSQAELRLGRRFSDTEMQEASNAVAFFDADGLGSISVSTGAGSTTLGGTLDSVPGAANLYENDDENRYAKDSKNTFVNVKSTSFVSVAICREA